MGGQCNAWHMCNVHGSHVGVLRHDEDVRCSMLVQRVNGCAVRHVSLRGGAMLISCLGRLEGTSSVNRCVVQKSSNKFAPLFCM